MKPILLCKVGSVMAAVARAWRQGVSVLASAFMLASCGGTVGDLLSGVGSGGSGVAEGTITGFGSILVDDLRYDDSRAVLTRQGALGVESAPSLKLGQRVRVRSTQAGVADTVEVLAELVGPIESPPQAYGTGWWLRVMGQWVWVEGPSAAAAAAPTVIDTTNDDCDSTCRPLAQAMWVEIHGSWVLDAGKGVKVLRASRVEYVEASAAALVSGLTERVGNAVVIKTPSGQEVTLAGAGLSAAPNEMVRAWVPAHQVGSAALQASRAIQASIASSQHAEPVVLGGAIDQIEGNEVVIQGTRISIPPGLATQLPQLGESVRAELERTATGWQLKSAPAASRGASSGVVRIEADLSGNEVLRLAQGTKLRGTAIAPADSALLASSGCTALAAQPRLKVVLIARRGPLPLQVTALTCQAN